MSDIKEKVQKLITNAESRYDSNPDKARHGLEASERLLDQLSAQRNMSKHSPGNPFKELYNKIDMGWHYLNRKKRLEQGP